MNKQVWRVWRNWLGVILPMVGGFVAAAVGFRMLILTDFSNSGWEFMDAAAPMRWGFSS